MPFASTQPPSTCWEPTLTKSGHNARMRTRRKGLWIVAALLAVNATLLVAQPGLALPGSLGNYFFGPKLVRAEVLVKDGGALHDYRVDRGTIRNKAGGTLTLRTAPGAALFLAHEKRGLCARINAYLGRDAVAQLKFSQGGPFAVRPPAPKAKAAGALPSGDPSRRYQGPEGLAKALQALARRREP